MMIRWWRRIRVAKSFGLSNTVITLFPTAGFTRQHLTLWTSWRSCRNVHKYPTGYCYRENVR